MKLIQHIALNCRDHKAQEQFYTRHFGFRRSRVFNAGQPNEFVMLRLDDTCLELFTAAPEFRTQTGGPQPVGFSHLAFEVPDLDAAIASLRADNIQTEDIIDCSWVTPGLRICFFRDPDGNRIELMQGYKNL
ncbi:MAG: VOC family protein [Sedimentisphaerales bacterium]|nr:VOC family protein [Sedimentisphaerales bacterium]